LSDCYRADDASRCRSEMDTVSPYLCAPLRTLDEVCDELLIRAARQPHGSAARESLLRRVGMIVALIERE
jgi:hypothetical protein